jgi:hypothetical protein
MVAMVLSGIPIIYPGVNWRRPGRLLIYEARSLSGGFADRVSEALVGGARLKDSKRRKPQPSAPREALEESNS